MFELNFHNLLIYIQIYTSYSNFDKIRDVLVWQIKNKLKKYQRLIDFQLSVVFKSAFWYTFLLANKMFVSILASVY